MNKGSSTMNVTFRCDSSVDIGTGHVMRCLTLANALKEQGAQCEFICREHKGNIIERIAQQGFVVHRLLINAQRNVQPEQLAHSHWLGATQAQDAKVTNQILQKAQPDWLIVDHYALDSRWEREQRPYAKRIMAIDDLADRKHDCDLLLDQNLGKQPADYQALVPEHCQLLLGPQYALLRPEFAEWRPYSFARRKRPQLKQLLITLGGVDKDNVTSQVLDALAQVSLPNDISIVVVMGSKAPWIAQVKQQAAHFPYACDVRVGVNNMAELMANSDLAIGAAGSTSWERCCLGLPSLTIAIAPNQLEIIDLLESAGVSVKINLCSIRGDLLNFFEPENYLERMSYMKNNATKLVTVLGASQIQRLIFELL